MRIAWAVVELDGSARLQRTADEQVGDRELHLVAADPHELVGSAQLPLLGEPEARGGAQRLLTGCRAGGPSPEMRIGLRS